MRMVADAALRAQMTQVNAQRHVTRSQTSRNASGSSPRLWVIAPRQWSLRSMGPRRWRQVVDGNESAQRVAEGDDGPPTRATDAELVQNMAPAEVEIGPSDTAPLALAPPRASANDRDTEHSESSHVPWTTDNTLGAVPRERGDHVGATYLQGELLRTRAQIPAPRHGRLYHLYCSPHNAGALELAMELASKQGHALLLTQDAATLHACERVQTARLQPHSARISAASVALSSLWHMHAMCAMFQVLCYLNDLTWSSEEASEAFTQDVQAAMDAGVPLQLCNE